MILLWLYEQYGYITIIVWLCELGIMHIDSIIQHCRCGTMVQERIANVPIAREWWYWSYMECKVSNSLNGLEICVTLHCLCHLLSTQHCSR